MEIILQSYQKIDKNSNNKMKHDEREQTSKCTKIRQSRKQVPSEEVSSVCRLFWSVQLTGPVVRLCTAGTNSLQTLSVSSSYTDKAHSGLAHFHAMTHQRVDFGLLGN